MNEAARDDIFKAMRLLRLSGMIESYDEVMSDAIKRKSSIASTLNQL